MTAIVIRNTTAAQEAPAKTPMHPSGDRYRFEVLFNGFTQRAYADTAEEILGAMIPGYEAMDIGEQYSARLLLAIRAQVIIQANINHAADMSVASEAETAILMGNRDTQPEIEGWHCEIPLVLVDSYYQPEGLLPRPYSGIADVIDPPNILWVRPEEPYEFLFSLAHIGLIAVHQSVDTLP